MSNELKAAIKKDFAIVIKNVQQANSYFKRVWIIEDAVDKKFVVKLLENFDEYQLKHHEAEVAFAKIVNTQMQNLRSVIFTPDKNGAILHKINPTKDDYYVLMQYHPIIKKSELTPEEQQNLGKIMADMHTTLKDFQHIGFGTTYYMRDVNNRDMEVIEKGFPDKGYRPYLIYMQPLDYEALGLKLTILHGDWHQANMSFTDPYFLFDLDTLCKGTGVEELARTLTHWAIEPTEIKTFFSNLVKGYQLPSQEMQLAPLLMVAQLYRKYAEFHDYKDPQSMEDVKKKIEIIKESFNLS